MVVCEGSLKDLSLTSSIFFEDYIEVWLLGALSLDYWMAGVEESLADNCFSISFFSDEG